jgi:cation-transporting ATPase E
VAALAKQAGLGSDLPVVNGPDLAEMDDAQLAQAADEAVIFGRVTPHQKERLVGALRAQGHYVAMIGDGVNDVISLKGANVGIAMQSGSQAARGVADLVLLGDSFAALPWAFREGQRICAGMQDILNVFMVRLLSKALLIATVPLIAGFPFAPRQASLLSFFAAGVPAIALAAWAEPVPGAEREKTVFPRLARFAVPPGLLLALMGLGVYVGYLYTGEHTYLHAHLGVTHATAMAHSLTHAQTALTVFAVLCSLLLLPFTVPPTPFWTGGAQLRGDWRATLLAVGLVVVFAGVLAVPFGRHLFELSRLRIVDYALLVALTAIWGLLTRWLWRADLMARFLGVRSPEV